METTNERLEIWPPGMRCMLLNNGFSRPFPVGPSINLPAGTEGEIINAELRKSGSGDDYVLLTVVWDGFESLGETTIFADGVVGLGTSKEAKQEVIATE